MPAVRIARAARKFPATALSRLTVSVALALATFAIIVQAPPWRAADTGSAPATTATP